VGFEVCKCGRPDARHGIDIGHRLKGTPGLSVRDYRSGFGGTDTRHPGELFRRGVVQVDLSSWQGRGWVLLRIFSASLALGLCRFGRRLGRLSKVGLGAAPHVSARGPGN
jgi:hypothetical protein